MSSSHTTVKLVPKRHRKSKKHSSSESAEKESIILKILYWRRFCSRLIDLQAELIEIKQRIACVALDTCKKAISVFESNIDKSIDLEKLKRRKNKKMIRDAPPC